jgi:hypothetical protein
VLFDGRSSGLNCVEQGGLRWLHRVEADEQKSGLRWLRWLRCGKSSFGECGAQGFRKLRLGEELRTNRAAVEFIGPAGEVARVCVGDGSLQTAATAVGVQQQPRFGGKLGERVDGAEAGIDRVRRDDGTPEGVLLRGAEQQFGGATVEQKAVPEAGEPRIPGEDCRRLPVGEAAGALVEIVPVVQGSRGALVGGQNGPAALQRLLNLPGQLGGRFHTPFIRLPDAENAVRDARVWSGNPSSSP